MAIICESKDKVLIDELWEHLENQGSVKLKTLMSSLLAIEGLQKSEVDDKVIKKLLPLSINKKS